MQGQIYLTERFPPIYHFFWYISYVDQNKQIHMNRIGTKCQLYKALLQNLDSFADNPHNVYTISLP